MEAHQYKNKKATIYDEEFMEEYRKAFQYKGDNNKCNKDKKVKRDKRGKEVEEDEEAIRSVEGFFVLFSTHVVSVKGISYSPACPSFFHLIGSSLVQHHIHYLVS